EWEAAAEMARPLGMRVVQLRTGIVLGRQGGAWPLLRRVFRAGLGGRLGKGTQWMPWIHIEDEIGIILHAIENENCSGPMNMASPQAVTNSAFTQAVGHCLKRPTFMAVPAWFLRWA